MHINKISYSPSHTAIYRLHGQVDNNKLFFDVIRPYMVTHHHGLAIQRGENPYSVMYYEDIDNYLTENNYSKSWLIQNAKNNGLDGFADIADDYTLSIITEAEDADAIRKFVIESEKKDRKPFKEKFLEFFGVLSEEKQQRARTYDSLPKHLKYLYISYSTYNKICKSYNEQLKDRLVDVYSIKELYNAMMREKI